MEAGIRDGVREAIRQRCDCDFSTSDIVDGVFSCRNVTTEVTYRATLRGRIDTDRAGRLRSQVRRFVQRGPAITYDTFLLWVDSTCPVNLSSLTDPECPNITPVLAGYCGK